MNEEKSTEKPMVAKPEPPKTQPSVAKAPADERSPKAKLVDRTVEHLSLAMVGWSTEDKQQVLKEIVAKVNVAAVAGPVDHRAIRTP